MSENRKRARLAVLALAGLAGCAHYEDKPVVAPDNLAAIEARTLASSCKPTDEQNRGRRRPGTSGP